MIPNESQKAWIDEPMCSLDPLLFIPRIEYIDSIFSYIEFCNFKYTLVILDLKNFHIINDIFNYNTGDKVLSQFISMLRLELPQKSITLRFRHGDEFLFFVPLEVPEVETLFIEFRNSCEKQNFISNNSEKFVVISFCFACMELDLSQNTVEEILQSAELKLRLAKGQGSSRNL